jgi:diadenosine tetraphosphate (Ap4A) HIT family hydrolase
VTTQPCPLCNAAAATFRNAYAYARPDDHALGPGHHIVVPFRHVADFFAMTTDEKHAVLELLDQVQLRVASELKPDGFNIGVNVGQAAGQSRMHVHIHLIPRFRGDVSDPRGGVRCVLTKKPA